MRQMFDLLSSVGQQSANTIKHQIKNGSETTFEFKDLAKRFTVDVIATCAFGIEVDSFKNPKNDFHRIAEKFMNFFSFTKMLKFFGFFLMPSVMKALNIRLFDTETTDFFQGAISETMKAREEKGIIRHDLIDLLLQAKKKELTHKNEDNEEKLIDGFATVEESHVGKSIIGRKWDDDDLTAQCFIFFFAGLNLKSILRK